MRCWTGWPIIFEGNAFADVRDNMELKRLLAATPATRPATARAWLGAPNSIKGRTEAWFQRQSGSPLLVVGQSAERALLLLSIAIVSLAAQYPAGQARFVILDPHAYAAGGDGSFQKLSAVLQHPVYIGGPGEVSAVMGELAAELEARGPSSGREAPEFFHHHPRSPALQGAAAA